MTGPIIAAILTYLLMLLAFKWRHLRRFHMSVMIFIICFDIGMPFYLVATRDWKTRLIDNGDILSFGVWMHFGLIITLYVLYAIQIQTVVKMLRARKQAVDPKVLETARDDHRAQGMGILLARGLVIATGAILADPMSEEA